MRRYQISITAVIVVLAMNLAAFGQREGSSDAGRRGAMRQRWESMSEQQREEFGAQMRERRAARRNEQLEAIKTIEEQLGKLKEDIAADSAERRPFSELSEQERAELRQQRDKLREERQKAIGVIIEQIARLQGQRQPEAEGEQFIIVGTEELKAIRELALKEKADETAQRLEMIGRGRRDFRGMPPGPEQRPSGLQSRESGVEELEAAKKAPEFTLESFDGEKVILSDYKGKIVVLEWFNLECPFVRYHYDTVPTMYKLANKYKDKNVVWLAVNSTSHTTQEANKEFAMKFQLPYLILDDRSGKVGRAYGAKTTPHMFIIDTRGNIVYAGAIDNSPMGSVKEGVINYVDKALEELTSGKAVGIVESKPYGCSVKYAD